MMSSFLSATDDGQICHMLMKPAQRPEPKRSELSVEVQKQWQEIPREQLQREEESRKSYFGNIYKGKLTPLFHIS